MKFWQGTLGNNEVNLKVLKGASNLCLNFGKGNIRRHIDANIACDINGGKFTSIFMFTFVGELYHGNTNYKRYMALFITEAKYIVVTKDRKEILWIMVFIQEMGLKQYEYVVYCD